MKAYINGQAAIPVLEIYLVNTSARVNLRKYNYIKRQHCKIKNNSDCTLLRLHLCEIC